jgi:dephospho-CoA kinase
MLVGLTGGIGSGKSKVLEIFKSLGANVEDTDSIVHEIYEENEEVHKQLLNRWGNKVFQNNSPDRKVIAGIVFNDKKELKWLNQLMHPLVKERIAAKQNEKFNLIAVPLLYEVNWHSEFDTVVSVWCSQKNQQKRLINRGWSESEIKARISAQIDQNEKITRADYGIINDWSLKSLNRQCRSIYNTICKETVTYG